MSGSHLIGYGGKFTELTKELKEKDPEKYETDLLVLIFLEGKEKGMKATTIGKPTKTGTYVNFTRIKSRADADKYGAKLMLKSNELKAKYGVELIVRNE